MFRLNCADSKPMAIKQELREKATLKRSIKIIHYKMREIEGQEQLRFIY